MSTIRLVLALALFVAAACAEGEPVRMGAVCELRGGCEIFPAGAAGAAGAAGTAGAAGMKAE